MRPAKTAIAGNQSVIDLMRLPGPGLALTVANLNCFAIFAKRNLFLPLSNLFYMRFLFRVIFLGAVLLLVSCTVNESRRPIVTVSIPPQKFFLEQITGNAYDIRCLLTSGGNAESYEPSFTNLLNTRNSVAYLAMGNIGFEDAVIDKIRNENPELLIFDTSRGIHLITGTHGSGEVDPHVWTSVNNARIIACNMTEAMVLVDPSRTEMFRANCRRFTAKLDSLDRVYRLALADAPGRAFLVWHPSLSYFARDYSLCQIAIGGVEDREVSIPALKKHIEEARASGAKVLFVQKDADSRQAETANVQIGADEVEINLLDYDWIAQMDRVVNAISALR